MNMLSHPSGDIIVTLWEKLVKYDPEVIVIAPCGFDIDRTAEEMQLLSEKKEWPALKAVRGKKVFLADFDLFTQPSASTLVDGIDLLAALFHPQIFSLPESAKQKYRNFVIAENRYDCK